MTSLYARTACVLIAVSAVLACGGTPAVVQPPTIGAAGVVLRLTPTGDPTLDGVIQSALIERGYTLVEATTPADATIEVNRSQRGESTTYAFVALARDGHVISVGVTSASESPTAAQLGSAVAQLQIRRTARSPETVAVAQVVQPTADAGAYVASDASTGTGVATNQTIAADPHGCSAKAQEDPAVKGCLMAVWNRPDREQLCKRQFDVALRNCNDVAHAEEAEQRRRDAAEVARKEREAEHAASCKASYATRLAHAKIDAARIPTERASALRKCAALRPNCTIIEGANTHAICRGTSAEDLGFYNRLCTLPADLVLPQTPAMVHSGDCADVDPVNLDLPMSATDAQIATIEHAR